jgi:putative exosortase-associated protein (TIGR04073 family)
MKRLLCAAVIAVFAAGSAFAGAFDKEPEHHHAGRKLGRGFANVLFGVVEVPNQITRERSEHGGAAAVTYGLGKGVAFWFGRTLLGAYEIATFPIPPYRPLVKPEFPIEQFEP